ncbi:Unknown protein [Striga hermonthica]|uniref:DUF4283 domain-containing protein n=1 Tax=Striga hermonthica TaxID=68872 RepID=A0A9N7MTJ0_STRHE|nr:Unknown protein [Striga hermonthica]
MDPDDTGPPVTTLSATITDDLGSLLQNIALSESEGNIISLRDDYIKISVVECKRSLFGKVIGDRRAGLIGVRQTMGAIWQIQGQLEVKELKTNYFQFIFGSMEDKLKVLKGTHWFFKNQYLVLAEWEEGKTENHRRFSELQLWVQVSNIPINWLCTEVGLKVGTSFLKVKNMTVVKAGGSRGSFLILLAVIDASKPLPRVAHLKLHNTRVMAIFQYEKLVNVCFYCGIIGNLERGCKKKMEDIANRSLKEGQYGEWLRAVDGPYGYKSSSTSNPDSASPEDNTHNHDTSHAQNEVGTGFKSASSGVQAEIAQEMEQGENGELDLAMEVETMTHIPALSNQSEGGCIGKDKFKQHFRVVVRQDRNIIIWNDPWLPGREDSLPTKTSVGMSRVTWVSKLLQDDGKSWNRDLLEDCFQQQDVEEILKIGSLDPLLHDKWIWMLDSKALLKSLFIEQAKNIPTSVTEKLRYLEKVGLKRLNKALELVQTLDNGF